MELEIREVKNRKDLKAFINLPWVLFENHPHWVSPLKIQMSEILSSKHPFYETSEIKKWVAIKDGRVVGRIAAIINHHHNKFHEEKCGQFGFFELIDDQDVAHQLIQTASKYLQSEGMEKIRGPFAPSTNYECGLLVEGYDDPPQIMMPYAPPYYLKLLEQEGFSKIKDLLAYKLPIETEFPTKILSIAERTLKNNGLTCRSLNKGDWDNEIKRFKEIYNAAWEKNWGFIPFTDNEFIQLSKDLKPIIDEKLALIIEMKGNPIGIILAIPDYNQIIKKIKNGKLLPFGLFKLLMGKRKISRARILLLGIKKEFRHLGLSTLFFIEIKKAFQSLPQYKEVEMSWILEDNAPMNAPLQLINAQVYKKYRILEKKLN